MATKQKTPSKPAKSQAQLTPEPALPAKAKVPTLAPVLPLRLAPVEPAPAGKPAPTPSAAPAPKRSALDAAAVVLAESGQPMNCQALITAMAAKGYWTSPGGKTPQATLYAAILRELTTKGTASRFRKTARGQFALALPPKGRERSRPTAAEVALSPRFLLAFPTR